jgi:hypothetical protein
MFAVSCERDNHVASDIDLVEFEHELLTKLVSNSIRPRLNGIILEQKLTLAEAPFCSLCDWINFNTFNQGYSRLFGERTFVYKCGCKSLERTTQRRHKATFV